MRATCEGCLFPQECESDDRCLGYRTRVLGGGKGSGQGADRGGAAVLNYTQPPRKRAGRVLLLTVTEGVLVGDGPAWLVHRRLDGPWVPVRQLEESALDLEPPLARMLEGSRDG